MSSKSTKAQLAATLKNMMRTQDLDHITIEELTKQAGVTRNTFYYHFTDINDLLKWVFEQEIGQPMRQHAQFDEWQSAYRLLLTYITDNREFCIASFHSVGRDLLEQVLYDFAFQLTTSVVDDVDAHLPKQLHDDIGDFFGLAIVAQVTFWLRNGMQESSDRLIQRADIMLHGAIKNAVKNGRDVYGYYEVDPH